MLFLYCISKWYACLCLRLPALGRLHHVAYQDGVGHRAYAAGHGADPRDQGLHFVELDKSNPMAYSHDMIASNPVTVIETPSFLRDSKKLLDDDERTALVNHLAYNPLVGNLISGAGGIRKVRWARENEGKSGGFRVIYFYHSENIPLFVLNIFSKNEKASISQAERNELKTLTALLVENYSAGGREK